jgi:hypothetical protein
MGLGDVGMRAFEQVLPGQMYQSHWNLHWIRRGGCCSKHSCAHLGATTLSILTHDITTLTKATHNGTTLRRAALSITTLGTR